MGAFAKLFGLGLVIGGLLIGLYWTLWILTITVSIKSNYDQSLKPAAYFVQPYVGKQFPADLKQYFLDPVWIFRLPAVALIGGIAFISYFINNTSKKIAAARAAAAAKAAAAQPQKKAN